MTNAFQKAFNESGSKPNKTWVDSASEFCNRSMKSWLHGNGIKMYSVYKGKSVVAKRFIRTVKSKIYKHIWGIKNCAYW